MTGPRKVSFVALLTPNDRFRHTHVRFKNEILGFVVQYETKLKDVWLPVVRYDTEHGYAHRDLMDRQGGKQKTPMFTRDYNEALTFAEYDIKTSWMAYKHNFIGGEQNGDEQKDE